VVPGYPCCSFRGSMVALDVHTGEILWKTYMAPVGFSGNAIWGSAPAVDTKRGAVYVATGNNYSVPDEVLDCVIAAGDDPVAKAACLPSDNYFDAVLSLDTKTGRIKWATRALPYDAWTADCIPFFGDGDNCTEPAGPDYDFGQAPAPRQARPFGALRAAALVYRARPFRTARSIGAPDTATSDSARPTTSSTSSRYLNRYIRGML
jgi:polyvinyl alcohol dehydrogenase (cytochrome)